MNYQNILKSVLSTQKKSNLSAFAFLAGLSGGAALAILFTPQSGKETRQFLLKALILEDEKSDNKELDVKPIDNLSEVIREKAEKLLGPENKRKDPTKINVPSAGTLAWQNQSPQEHHTPYKKH
jgi:gas vesicle protein